VVLSGGGHDGATGATAVHQFGGTVLASDELTSEYFSMPQATIERDSVIARIVPLGEIAALLVSNAPHRRESQKSAHEPVARREGLADERERLAGVRDLTADECEKGPTGVRGPRNAASWSVASVTRRGSSGINRPSPES
jgi:hypothetical protein